ncbi:ABC-2 family transporter protein [Candidatus Methanoplasma termitum]|uniref:ABC-2 family transporter protein n=1 Tax=Candidatus Methanoplasma termitum TaxID=1577791 RepID=A0A0A7LCZ0_9ARCH|nr:ABC transporter permease [Candidatus Methanoplasma termitum]AIZ56939.1 ABC-2 family transporter protein [Candidatus Methanoplasma termitum]MCL2333533.1 ABC transporter permease [Candidatus Methanoplasma sp.]
MNHLVNLTKKELKELLTPAALIPIVVIALIFVLIGSAVGGEVSNATGAQKIGFVNNDVPTPGETDFSLTVYEGIINFYNTTYGLSLDDKNAGDYIITLDAGTAEQITQEMIDKGIGAAIGIDPGFSDKINTRDPNVPGTISTYYVFQNKGLVSSATGDISTLTTFTFISHEISVNLAGNDTDAQFILTPVVMSGNPYTNINGTIYNDGVTPSLISSSLQSQNTLVPIIIMIVIMMIGSMVISSMGNEKENKTLETLLTIPVSRTTIVFSKLLGSAIVGLIYGIIYMIGMSVYISNISGSIAGANLSDYGLGMGIEDYAIMGIMIFLAIFCGLGLCMIMGAFAKNYRAAQTMLMPITVLAIVPMFVTLFSSWSALPTFLKGVMFAIPFSHPMMAMNNLMFGNMTLIFAGIVYMLIFALVTILITVRIYKSDILLTGIGKGSGKSLLERRRALLMSGFAYIRKQK